MKSKKSSLMKIALAAFFSACSAVILLLTFPIPFFPPHLKMEFSDLPSLIASFSLGPIYGVVVCIVKALVNLPTTENGGIGELANCILGSTFSFTAGMIYRHNKTKLGAWIACFSGAFAMAIMAFPVNSFILLPTFSKLYGGKEVVISIYNKVVPQIDSLWKAALYIHVPFTLLKGAVVALVTFAVYKRISLIIKKISKSINERT